MRGNDIPQFRGRRALLLFGEGRDREMLQTQLRRLGMQTECRDLADSLPWSSAHVCIFDADAERRPRFLSTIERPVIPLIAVVGTETPERIQWNLSRGVSSFLIKPLRAAGIFLALMQADFTFTQQLETATEIEDLKERVRSRRVVFSVMLHAMRRHRLDENAAYERLRTMSMRRNISIEELCVAIARSEFSDTQLMDS
jgi:AmiR/NasT family two-component response regulator